MNYCQFKNDILRNPDLSRKKNLKGKFSTKIKGFYLFYEILCHGNKPEGFSKIFFRCTGKT